MTRTVQAPAELTTLECPSCHGLTEARVGPWDPLVHRCPCGYQITESEWQPRPDPAAPASQEDDEPADVDTSGADELDYDDEPGWADDLADTEDDTP